MNDLFASADDEDASSPLRPLADRVRPSKPEELFGQEHLLGVGKPLRQALDDGRLHSMIFWGPPGVGKTTLARMLATVTDAHFIALSAVMAGVRDIRAAVAEARAQQAASGRATVLFLDEVHRFNKAQQDAFLPFVEDGTLTFVGATTENPSFELNNALLSRARIYVLKPLAHEALRAILRRALQQGGEPIAGVEVADAALEILIEAADGDARRALNLLEQAAGLTAGTEPAIAAEITAELAAEVAAGGRRRFDKRGEYFYDQISALHKSIRGSDPDAALYWLMRMLDGGCEPTYLARRLVRVASEDVGNADPRALRLCLDAWETFDRLGSPEGELAIAQAVVFLACAAKSNAVYKAAGAAAEDAARFGSLEVPLRLRNAPTGTMKTLGYGAGYRYAHDEEDGVAYGERYFPDDMPERTYYHPVARGLEEKIADKLAAIRERNRRARR